MQERKRLGDIISELPGQITGLISAEINNLKSEITKKIGGLAKGGALLAVAGVLALFMLGWLFVAGYFAWNLLVPEWAAALLTAASILVIILIFAIPGLIAINKNKDFGNLRSVDSIKDDVNMVRGLGHAADGTSPMDDLRDNGKDD